MSAPPKPWERVGQNSRVPPSQPSFLDEGWDVHNQRSTTAQSGMSSTPAVSRTPPLLPTRPAQQNSLLGTSSMMNRYGYGGYGGYGMGYGGSYGGMYGGYGSMYNSPYGGGMYGAGYGSGGLGPNGMNSSYSQFLRRAEESSRPAFQSIESIVMAFASVSMMMESTFQTVYNCFRAVLGVADHFSRLKLHLAKIFSAIALFRTLRYLYRRILVWLGARPMEFANEIWKEIESDAVTLGGQLDKKAQKKNPSWPIFMFFAVVVGGPYIIWRLLSSVSDEPTEQEAWASGEEDHVVARAEFDFEADNPNEVSFRSGTMLNLAPKELQPKVRGWLLASVDGKTTGLVPHNYIKILGKKRGSKYTQADQQQTTMTSQPPARPVIEDTPSRLSVLNPSRSQANLAAFDKAYSAEEQSDFSFPTENTQPQQLKGADGWSSWTAEATQNKVQAATRTLPDLEKPQGAVGGVSLDTESQKLENDDEIALPDFSSDKT